MTERQILERLKELRNNTLERKEHSDEELEIIDRNKREWLTFWRRNINLYIIHKLGIRSYPFQQWSYYLMNDSTTYEEVATRGTSKTFKMAVYGFAECMLKPFSKVVFTASTFGQATRVLEEKIKPEIIGQNGFSQVLRYFYDKGYIKIFGKDQSYIIEFFNGSTFTIVPCLDSARGLRATTVIFEECRLMKKGMIDSIFENMAQPRMARFRTFPEYSGEEYQEETQTIYITSNRTRNEWFFTLFKNLFVGYFKDRLSKSKVFAVDIFVAIKYGLKTKRWYLAQKRKMNELDFRMEVLNEALGEVEDAYFTYDMFKKNQVVRKAFMPRNKYVKSDNRKLREGELRLIYVDLAFASGEGNDNTVIGCLNFYPRGDEWHRECDYLESRKGGKEESTALRIKELFWDYGATYLILDLRNGGEYMFDTLTKELIHPNRPDDEWNRHGFGLYNDNDIQVVGKPKLDELLRRTEDPSYIPCIIPVQGTAEFNSNMWIDLAQRMRTNEIRFLIDDLDFTQMLDENKKTMFLSDEEKAEIRYPYVQTMLLMNEGVNLTANWTNGQVKLSNPNTTKDKIVALGYGNYIATKIINKENIKRERNTDFDISQYEGLMF